MAHDGGFPSKKYDIKSNESIEKKSRIGTSSETSFWRQWREGLPGRASRLFVVPLLSLSLPILRSGCMDNATHAAPASSRARQREGATARSMP